MRRSGGDVQPSGKEREVARLFLAEGLSNKDVAEKMGCSESTVYAHSQSMYRGLDVNSRAQVVQWFLQHPRAWIEGEWSDWQTHPVGCECLTLPYCTFARLELARVKLAA